MRKNPIKVEEMTSFSQAINLVLDDMIAVKKGGKIELDPHYWIRNTHNFQKGKRACTVCAAGAFLLRNYVDLKSLNLGGDQTYGLNLYDIIEDDHSSTYDFCLMIDYLLANASITYDIFNAFMTGSLHLRQFDISEETFNKLYTVKNRYMFGSATYFRALRKVAKGL